MRANVGRIDSVLVNGGACAPHNPPSLPRTLNYGETLGDFVYFCEPTEASVTTDRGVFTFQWSGAEFWRRGGDPQRLPGEPARRAIGGRLTRRLPRSLGVALGNVQRLR